MKRLTLMFILCAGATVECSAQVAGDFTTSARSGNTTAQYNLAQCYRYGWGTEPNASEWLHFLRLSAEGGERRAAEELAEYLAPLAPEIAAYWRGEEAPSEEYTYHSFDEGCYYGELLGGTRDGYGSFVWDSGTYYLGEWEDGERYGLGVTHFDNQSIYGTHIGGQMEGFGAIVITAEGCHLGCAAGSTRYVGYFHNGLPEGVGTLYDASGEVTYYGPFKDGVPTDHYPTTDHYSDYRWHKEVLPNGDCWEGESFEGVRQGWGIYRWADGSWWCGYWQNGLREGEGLFVRSDGAMMQGTWEDGELRAEN